MNKKLQVFVSSTYTDLIEERQAAVQAILDAGHIPAGMELFKAGKSQMETIKKWIDESDVYMLILGGRYGSIENESGLSYTELEYRYALSKNMPVFAIVIDDTFLIRKAATCGKDKIFEKDNNDKYENFKEYVKGKVVRFPKNIDQISSIIASHLSAICDDPDYNLIGWSRNRNITDIYLYSLDSNPNQMFNNTIINAKKVTIIGKTMINVLNSYEEILKESLKAGCEYRILAFDYNKELQSLYSTHSHNNHMTAIESWQRMQDTYPNLKYKLTNKWPSYGITSIEYEQKEKNYIQILFYSETMKGLQRPMLKISYDNEWYNKFANEIEHLWSSDSKYTIKN